MASTDDEALCRKCCGDIFRIDGTKRAAEAAIHASSNYTDADWPAIQRADSYRVCKKSPSSSALSAYLRHSVT
jgi:hypothetical protein